MSSHPDNLPGIEKLLKYKYRLTPQRKSVLFALAESKRGEHHTAESIYKLAQKNCPQIGLATVYRTLEIFSKLSIVQYLVLDDGCHRYELKRDVTHHHLICLSCGTIMESDLKNSSPLFPGRPDFQVTSSSVRFFGHCKTCHKERNISKDGG